MTFFRLGRREILQLPPRHDTPNQNVLRRENVNGQAKCSVDEENLQKLPLFKPECDCDADDAALLVARCSLLGWLGRRQAVRRRFKRTRRFVMEWGINSLILEIAAVQQLHGLLCSQRA